MAIRLLERLGKTAVSSSKEQENPSTTEETYLGIPVSQLTKEERESYERSMRILKDFSDRVNRSGRPAKDLTEKGSSTKGKI